MKRLDALLIVLFATMVVGTTWGMVRVRRATLERATDPAFQADYAEWVEEAKRQSSDGGPVKRRPPKSFEPPILVLMRDYFLASLGSVLVFATALFLTFAFLLRGALRPGRSEKEALVDQRAPY